jgi:hypothetical protein
MKSFSDFIESFKQIEPLSNFQILDICKQLKIKNFRGVFMRDQLNLNEVRKNNHCLILNLDVSDNDGTHWTCIFVTKDKCIYFDPFGFCPPPEVEKYCSTIKNRIYNTFQVQKANSVICGHFCIYVLYKLSNCGEDLFNITDELYHACT